MNGARVFFIRLHLLYETYVTLYALTKISGFDMLN